MVVKVCLNYEAIFGASPVAKTVCSTNNKLLLRFYKDYPIFNYINNFNFDW